MGWREWLESSSPETPAGEEEQKSYWRSQLGTLLLDQKAAAFDQQVKKANPLPISSNPHVPGNTAEREQPLERIAAEKKTAAPFSHKLKESLRKTFENEINNNPLLMYTIEALETEYQAFYQYALELYAIERHLNPTADIRLDDKHNSIIYLKRAFAEQCPNAMRLTVKELENKYGELYANQNALNSVSLEQVLQNNKDKQSKAINRWRARWFGLKNSKYFALSCGTTMAGVLLMIAAKIGDPIFLGFTAVCAIPIIYVVTRANWWLTNKAIPDLMEELASPTALVKNFFKKLRENPFQRLFIFISTLTASIVWAAFTYDTTLQLGNELFDQPAEMFGWNMDAAFRWATLIVGATSSLVQIIRDFTSKGRRPLWFKMPWLSLATLGLGIAGFLIDPALFRTIGILTVTIFMTVFTAPTIYAVFGLYTERAMKALSGPVDADGKDNAFHGSNIDRSFESITASVKAAGNDEIARFQATYRNMQIMGFLLAICATFVLRNMVMDMAGFDFNTTTEEGFGASWEGGVSFLLSGIVVAIGAFSVFNYIDYKNPVTSQDSTEKALAINKNMIYKSTFILAAAALVGALAIDIASEHIMANVFTKWFGATDDAAQILNYVITFGLGIAGSAAFYTGSAKNAVEKFYQPKAPGDDTSDLDKADPSGRQHTPDFSDIAYQHKSTLGKAAHTVKDTANLFGIEPGPKTFDITVAFNSFFNALPALFSGLSMILKGFFFFGCAGAASAAGNYGAGNPKPDPLPDCESGEKNIDMQERILRFSVLSGSSTEGAQSKVLYTRPTQETAS